MCAHDFRVAAADDGHLWLSWNSMCFHEFFLFVCSFASGHSPFQCVKLRPHEHVRDCEKKTGFSTANSLENRRQWRAANCQTKHSDVCFPAQIGSSTRAPINHHSTHQLLFCARKNYSWRLCSLSENQKNLLAHQIIKSKAIKSIRKQQSERTRAVQNFDQCRPINRHFAANNKFDFNQTKASNLELRAFRISRILLRLYFSGYT